MEVSQENSLLFKKKLLNKQKYHFLNKIREREEEVLSGDLLPLASGEKNNVGKVCRRVNMVQMLCTHVQMSKWKNESC
jgi:hypothetical protein